MNMFAFLYVKVNSKEVCEEISFREILMSAFLLRFKAIIISKKCVATPIFLCGYQ